MARAAKKTKAKQTSDSAPRKSASGTRRPFRPLRWFIRLAVRGGLVLLALVLLLVVLYRVVDPPTTYTMWSEGKRLGAPVDHVWVDADDIAPVMLRDPKLAQDMAKRLDAKGVYVAPFSFPVVPKGEDRIRTQMSAAHSRDELDRAIDAFIEVGRDMKIIKGAGQ